MDRYGKFFSFLLGFFLYFSPAFPQAWLKDMESKKSTAQPDFYEIQSAFIRYWHNKEIEKGKGWKQFKRWENFMEPRVYPDGKIYLPSLTDDLGMLKLKKIN